MTVLVAACGSGSHRSEGEVELRLPHVNAPLDTVNVIETAPDTGSVEIASGAALGEPAWTNLETGGLPDPKSLHFSRYENPAYGYSIAYPDSLIRPVQNVGEDRGAEFASSAGDVRMLVYAAEESGREDLDAQYRSALGTPDATITYRARDDDWYIVSGEEGEWVFYEKAISHAGKLTTFRIQYPTAQKAYYDAVTAIMSASFRNL